MAGVAIVGAIVSGSIASSGGSVASYVITSAGAGVGGSAAAGGAAAGGAGATAGAGAVTLVGEAGASGVGTLATMLSVGGKLIVAFVRTHHCTAKGGLVLAENGHVYVLSAGEMRHKSVETVPLECCLMRRPTARGGGIA